MNLLKKVPLKKGGNRGMFIRILQNPINTLPALGIPMGKSPLVRGEFFLIQLRP
jgi:hypothetical protein